MKRASALEVYERLRDAGYDEYILEFWNHPEKSHLLCGKVSLAILDELSDDPRFANGIFHALHPDVGIPRTEYRSHRNELGEGSLQIVINTATGRFEADVDQHPPYSDVVGQVAHLFGEVLWPKLKSLFRWRNS